MLREKKGKPASPSPPAEVAMDFPGNPNGYPIAHDFFLRARRLELEGKSTVALGYFRIAFQYDPNSSDLCFILLDRLKESGNIDSALAMSKQCLKLPSQLTSVQYQLLGEIYLRKDDSPTAITFYEKALELDEGDRDALYILAGLYEKKADFPRYAQIMEKLLPQIDFPPRLVDKLLQVYGQNRNTPAATQLLKTAWEKTRRPAFGESLISLYESQGLCAEFLEVAQTLVQDYPETSAYALNQARAMESCNQKEAALNIYRALLKDYPNDKDILSHYGILLFGMGKFKEATIPFASLAKSYPKIALYHYYLGAAGMEIKRPDAHASLQLAAILEPNIPEYWAKLIYADLVLGKKEGGFSRLDSLTPGEDPWKREFFRGLVFSQVANFLDPKWEGKKSDLLWDSGATAQYRVQAVTHFRKALSLNPNQPRILFDLSSTLERLGQRPESISLLRQLVQVDSLNPIALNYLGYMLVEDSTDLDYAGRLLDRALELDPDNGSYLDSKGWWHYRKQEYKVARSLLEKALLRMPEEPTLLEHLAKVLEHLSESEAAFEKWSLLHKVNPLHPEAKRKSELKP